MKKILTIIILSTSLLSVSALDIGSRGKEVVTLQKLLNSKGYKLPVTGFYGQMTKIAHQKYLASLKPVVIAKIPVATSTATSTDVYVNGVKILSPLYKYGFYQESVLASFNGEEGFYNQTTKTFMPHRVIEQKNAEREQISKQTEQTRIDYEKKQKEGKTDYFTITLFGRDRAIDEKGREHSIVCLVHSQREVLNTVDTAIKERLDKRPFLGNMVMQNFGDYNEQIRCGVIDNTNGVKSYIIKDIR